MSTLSRLEGFVLKPFAITFLVFMLISLFQKNWWFATCFCISWLLITKLGVSFHKSKSFKQLAKGTLKPGWTDKDPELTYDISFALAKYAVSIAIICTGTMIALGYHYGRTLLFLSFAGIGLFTLVFFFTACVSVGFNRRQIQQGRPTEFSTPTQNGRKGNPNARVEFTEEEMNWVNHSLESWIAFDKNNSPEGTQLYIHPKAKDALMAKGLTEYVEHLTLTSLTSTERERTVLLDKAVKAQMKAYYVHNLPAYVFRVAEVFEQKGDAVLAKENFQLFLSIQDKFIPDKVDQLFIDSLEIDIAEITGRARQQCLPESERRFIPNDEILFD